MKLPPEAVKQLQEAWLESFGEALGYEQAEAVGNNLIQTYDVLIGLALERQCER